MTAVEAIILGIPTLVSKIDVNYEVTKGFCSYYYPPEDEKELAEKILICLNSPANNSQNHDASDRLYEEYGYLNISKKYYKFFNDLIENKGD